MHVGTPNIQGSLFGVAGKWFDRKLWILSLVEMSMWTLWLGWRWGRKLVSGECGRWLGFGFLGRCRVGRDSMGKILERRLEGRTTASVSSSLLGALGRWWCTRCGC